MASRLKYRQAEVPQQSRKTGGDNAVRRPTFVDVAGPQAFLSSRGPLNSPCICPESDP